MHVGVHDASVRARVVAGRERSAGANVLICAHLCILARSSEFLRRACASHLLTKRAVDVVVTFVFFLFFVGR